MRYIGKSFFTFLIVLSISCNLIGQSSEIPWNISKLYEVPEKYAVDTLLIEGMSAFFYDGLDYKNTKTKVYAYYKAPLGQPPKGGWPAVVLVHGGGGTAFPEWVQTWVDHGYAAIAMDLEGHWPTGKKGKRISHKYAGPSRAGVFKDIGLADQEQWFYHAVGNVIQAHSLLRSFPNININKIGIHGISWGGVITSTVVGIDKRLAFAIPVYGCGFLYDSELWKPSFEQMSSSELNQFKSRWDPSIYLSRSKIPMMFYVGSNDKHFNLNIWQRSVLEVKGKVWQSIPVTRRHGHLWEEPEVFAFADAVVGIDQHLWQVSKTKIKRNKAIAKVALHDYLPTDLSQMQLVYTSDSGLWAKKKWNMLPATYKRGKVQAKIPKEATYFYLNIKDSRGRTFSSTLKEKK